MTNSLKCPICTTVFNMPEVGRSQAVANALGLSVDAMHLLHLDQARHRLEEALNQHLSNHGPEDWLPVLMGWKMRAEHAENEHRHQMGRP